MGHDEDYVAMTSTRFDDHDGRGALPSRRHDESEPATQHDVRLEGPSNRLRRAGGSPKRAMQRARLRRPNLLSRQQGEAPQLKRYLDEMPGHPLQTSGLTSTLSTRKPTNVSATRRKSPSRCWSASSTPAATPATWCSTRSAAAARRLTRRRSWAASGLASTSRNWPRR